MAAVTGGRTGTIPERDVRARPIDFDDAFDTMPRHFMGGDLVMSHVVAVLSSLFPDGEDFFVRSVRHYADRIEDPELAKQVRGFIGHEAPTATWPIVLPAEA